MPFALVTSTFVGTGENNWETELPCCNGKELDDTNLRILRHCIANSPARKTINQ